MQRTREDRQGTNTHRPHYNRAASSRVLCSRVSRRPSRRWPSPEVGLFARSPRGVDLERILCVLQFQVLSCCVLSSKRPRLRSGKRSTPRLCGDCRLHTFLPRALRPLVRTETTYNIPPSTEPKVSCRSQCKAALKPHVKALEKEVLHRPYCFDMLVSRVPHKNVNAFSQDKPGAKILVKLLKAK